jgi:predicted metal-dependent hydrolase
MSDQSAIGDLRFSLRRSSKRKSIGITVERDGSLTLAAPAECPLPEVEEFARDKQFWIYTKLAEKNLLFRPPPPKEYVSGEAFHYFGRTYRLKLVSDSAQDAPLRLVHGRFHLRRDAVGAADQHFVRWYVGHGRPWLSRRVERMAPRVSVAPGNVEVRDLGYRWGSCSATGGLNFHWRTLLLPSRIIEYIIAHELVHLRVPNHGAEFWRRLERAMPDYEERKQWLAEQGSRYA